MRPCVHRTRATSYNATVIRYPHSFEVTMPPLRLTIELVPSTCWYANLRDVLAPAAWAALRRQVFVESGNTCAICGARGRLHCHEVWSYDDVAHIQKLCGFLALCPLCHHVKHIGLAGLLASRGALSYARVIEHFLRVNSCDRAAFQRHYQEAMETWRSRSRYEWITDLGPYNPPPPQLASDQ
ncbi:MAG: HNH endonuclease [Ktedonobacterales bacterium]